MKMGLTWYTGKYVESEDSNGIDAGNGGRSQLDNLSVEGNDERSSRFL